MGFTIKLAQLTNSTANESVADALNKGVDYVISTVASNNKELLGSFAVDVDMGNQATGSAGFDWVKTTNSIHLLDVLKFEKQCRKIKRSQAKQAEQTDSIYYALNAEPVYFLIGQNKIRVLPDVSPSQKGTLVVVPSSKGRTIDDSGEEIEINNIVIGGTTNSYSANEGFPTIFHELVLLHAAECMIIERLVDFRAKLPTDLDADTTLFNQIADVSAQISLDTSLPSFTNPTFPASDVNDALTKAQNLIDGSDMGGDSADMESAQYWLKDEDEDMVQVTLGTAAQELSRANAILGDFNAELSHNVQAFQQGIAKMSTELSEEQAKMGAKLQEYQANLAKKIQLYNTVIQKLSTDYQWMTQQLQIITGKKQEFVANHIQPVMEVPERKI